MKLIFLILASAYINLLFSQEVESKYIFEKDDYLFCLKKTKEPFTGIMVGRNSDGIIEFKKTIVEGIENGKALF